MSSGGRWIPPVLLAAVATVATAAEFPQWALLEPGPHHVGFDVVPHRQGSRPVPMSIWYPAVHDDGRAPMRFREYIHQRAAEDDLEPLTEARRREVERRFVDYSGAPGAPYLELVAGVRKRDRDPSRFRPALFDAIRATRAYSLRFARLAHDDFTSDHLVNYVHTGRDTETWPVAAIDESYALLCRYVLWFMESALCGDDVGHARLERGPEAVDVPPGWVQIRRK